MYTVENLKTVNPKSAHSPSNVNNEICHCNSAKSHRILFFFVPSKIEETKDEQSIAKI